MWVNLIFIILALAQRLRNMHLQGIIHRDLHPKNVVFHFDAQKPIQGILPYIIDVGLSVINDEAAATDYSAFGVLKYLPPEVFRREPYTAASDVYCFGTLVWQIIVGVPPRGLAVDTGRSDTLREEPIPGCPTKLRLLIEECWSLDPEDRPTMPDVVRRLVRMQFYYQLSYISSETRAFIEKRRTEAAEAELPSGSGDSFFIGSAEYTSTEPSHGDSADYTSTSHRDSTGAYNNNASSFHGYSQNYTTHLTSKTHHRDYPWHGKSSSPTH